MLEGKQRDAIGEMIQVNPHIVMLPGLKNYQNQDFGVETPKFKLGRCQKPLKFQNFHKTKEKLKDELKRILVGNVSSPSKKMSQKLLEDEEVKNVKTGRQSFHARGPIKRLNSMSEKEKRLKDESPDKLPVPASAGMIQPTTSNFRF